jgi:hypothetical protein
MFVRLFMVACGLAFPSAAFAYIDPGTGAMMVQALLALVAAAVFYFRHPSVLWRDFKTVVRRLVTRMLGRRPPAVNDDRK